ncbi:hypothetical protein ALC57_17144 [Trachymyrmex cornetzi]|uniref:Uncharacterized protein n=1 Tax=Trachymyrmex cornetzi TaxID=471704 RepID=A0A195DDN0_9HYME|nr:hypothetical protein ALC57_17144 [Trachymyrmex cornetzi]
MSGHSKSSYTEATLADTQSPSLGKINADEGLGNRQGEKGRRLDPGSCEENARRGEVLSARTSEFNRINRIQLKVLSSARPDYTLPFALSLVRRNG